MEEYLRDIIDILDATEKNGKLTAENFPCGAWNSENSTSGIIKEMENCFLIYVERGEDLSYKHAILGSTGISVLRALKDEVVTKKLLSQAKEQAVSPSVAYIVESARRLAKELDI